MSAMDKNPNSIAEWRNKAEALQIQVHALELEVHGLEMELQEAKIDKGILERRLHAHKH